MKTLSEKPETYMIYVDALEGLNISTKQRYLTRGLMEYKNRPMDVGEMESEVMPDDISSKVIELLQTFPDMNIVGVKTQDFCRHKVQPEKVYVLNEEGNITVYLPNLHGSETLDMEGTYFNIGYFLAKHLTNGKISRSLEEGIRYFEENHGGA